MFIGDVEIPLVAEISEQTSVEVDEIYSLPSVENEIDNLAVKHKPSLKILTFTAYLSEFIHSQDLSIEEQKEEAKSLRRQSTEQNSIDFLDYKGHLSIREVDLTSNADSVVVEELTIEAVYHPWPAYFEEQEP